MAKSKLPVGEQIMQTIVNAHTLIDSLRRMHPDQAIDETGQAVMEALGKRMASRPDKPLLVQHRKLTKQIRSIYEEFAEYSLEKLRLQVAEEKYRANRKQFIMRLAGGKALTATRLPESGGGIIVAPRNADHKYPHQVTGILNGVRLYEFGSRPKGMFDVISPATEALLPLSSNEDRGSTSLTLSEGDVVTLYPVDSRNTPQLGLALAPDWTPPPYGLGLPEYEIGRR